MKALWSKHAEVRAFNSDIADAIDDLVNAINVPPFETSAILFPTTQVASKNAHTLDDYEEGTWTPIDASGAGLIFTFPIAAQYVKVGQLVIATGGVIFPAPTASGAAVQIGGLPFVSQNTQYAAPILYSSYALSVTGFVQASSTYVTYFGVVSGAQITNANFSGKDVRFTATYRAAT